MMNGRVGLGYDVHRLVEGRRLILGGIVVDYEKGLLGHSDADVLLHAIIDALLGAACMGDIGRHFPDTDAAYAGADSLSLLVKTRQLLQAEDFCIVNIDSVIVAQRPKLVSYIDSMRERIANALEMDVASVSVKAKTEEGLGFTGEGQGIAAHAVCLIEKSSESYHKGCEGKE